MYVCHMATMLLYNNSGPGLKLRCWLSPFTSLDLFLVPRGILLALTGLDSSFSTVLERCSSQSVLFLCTFSPFDYTSIFSLWLRFLSYPLIFLSNFLSNLQNLHSFIFLGFHFSLQYSTGSKFVRSSFVYKRLWQYSLDT